MSNAKELAARLHALYGVGTLPAQQAAALLDRYDALERAARELDAAITGAYGAQSALEVAESNFTHPDPEVAAWEAAILRESNAHNALRAALAALDKGA